MPSPPCLTADPVSIPFKILREFRGFRGTTHTNGFFFVFQWENRFRDWFSKIWQWMHWPLDFHCKNSFIDVNFGKNIIENGQKTVLLLFKNIYTLTVLFPYMLLIIPFVYWQPLKKVIKLLLSIYSY